ncbi:MAG: hypothetical protein UT82_C0024G0012 [Parcubacteria group bacterium GW2011_GWB1_40_14]|nr:MAG: hypothetical protein UT82_C0024G0012 [Parcubacteria group bacterium GW2011_GWB1_40_14]
MEQKPSKNVVDLRSRRLLAVSKSNLLPAHKEELNNLPALSERPALSHIEGSDPNVPIKSEKPKGSLPEKLPESDSLPFKLPALNPTEKSQIEKDLPFLKKEVKQEEPVSEIVEYENTLFSWIAPEYTYYEKDRKLWTQTTIIVAAIFILISLLFFKSYTATILTIVGAIIIHLLAFKKPRIISFGFTNEGIFAGMKFIPYTDISSFWIFYHPPDIKEIAFRSKKFFMPMLYFPLEDADPNEIRKILTDFLKEKEEQISLMDQLSRKIGF